MPAIWRTTLFFVQGDYSWSETYHYKLPDAPISSVRINAEVLAAARINLCGGTGDLNSSPHIPYIRISDDNTLRDAYPITKRAPFMSAHSSTGDYPVEPYDALVVRGDIDSRLRRKIWYISGLPSRVYNNPKGILSDTNGDWKAEWDIFVAHVTAHYGLFHQSIADADFPIREVFEMVQEGNRVQLTGILYPLGGQRLILRRGSYGVGSPKLQGRFYTIPSGNGNAVIVVPGLTAPIAYLRDATAQLENYVTEPLVKLTIVKKTHHKRGAQSGLVLRGRSKKRA